MCKLCLEYKLGKINNKQVYKQINNKLSKKNNKIDQYLLMLSSNILYKEIPISINDLEFQAASNIHYKWPEKK